MLIISLHVIILNDNSRGIFANELNENGFD